MRLANGYIRLIVQVMTVLLVAPAIGKIVYVDVNATGAHDGTSWANAYCCLQDALGDGNSGQEPVEIRVAQGIYTPDRSAAHPEGSRDREATFRLISHVTLRGGYAGQGGSDPNQRDVTLYKTTLSGDLKGDDRPFNPWGLGDDADARGVLEWEGHAGDNSYHVVTADSTDGRAMIDGFVIRAGNDDRKTSAGRDIVVWLGYGGGLMVSGGAQVRNCTFTENFAGTGGGLHGEDANLVIEDCVFSRNCARRGGGAYVKGSEAAFVNCVVNANHLHTIISSTPWIGAGLACDMSQVTITGCRFTGNRTAGTGGGIANVSQNSAIISHSLFTGNRASYGAGIYNQDSDLLATNCTFHGNRSYAIVCRAQHSLAVADVANCIFASWDRIDNRAGSVIRIQHSSIEDGQAQVRDLDPNGGLIWGKGNIEGDPCFAAPGYWDDPNTPNIWPDDRWVNGDYHLKSQAGRWDPESQSWVVDDVTSPCIDAGDPNSPIGLEPFPNGGRINMGAYGGTAEASKSYFGGPICETIIAGDINGDCKVDFKDLAILTRHWLTDAGKSTVPMDVSGQ